MTSTQVIQWATGVSIGIAAIAAAGIGTLRYTDWRLTEGVWRTLVSHTPAGTQRFEQSMVSSLPDPARRFFLYTIEEGTVLRTVSEITMGGEIGLGSKQDPKYMPMQAHQIIAPPHGLVWKVKAGSGLSKLYGSDGFDGARSWVRFSLWNCIPVVWAGGGSDHLRAAFGRVVAEAVFFAPAALLPQNGVTWEKVDANTARATVSHGGLIQAVDVTVDGNGQPHTVVIPRWSDANPEGKYRLQPFGGTVSEFRRFDGYMLPTKIEGGNFIGTPDYFPFYRAEIEHVRFLDGPSETTRPQHRRGAP